MSLNIANLDIIIDINKVILTVKELLVFVNYAFNELYIDKFWNNIENDKWLYIDDNMLKYIGYSDNNIRAGKQAYLKILNDNFENGVDYKSLFSKEFSMYVTTYIENIELNTHNKAKHLIVSPDCFKQSLMMLRTDKSKEIRKYYTELEKIFKFYLQYQSKYQELKIIKELENNKRLLEEEKNKNTNLTNNVIDYNQLLKKEYLYIATNTRYASQNNFKIGKTNDPVQRLRTYNTSHNKREHYYYVFLSEPTYYAKSIEYILKHILTKFKNSDTNEIYVVHYSFLEKIVKNVCENYDKSVDYYNQCIQEEMNNMSNIPIIPKDIWDVNNTKKVKQEAKQESKQEAKQEAKQEVKHEVKQEVKQEAKQKVEEEINYNGENVLVEYYEDNKEYKFIRFKSATDNKTNYKCIRCEYIFNRTDNIQSHFKRKTKCFDNSKNEKINIIKENQESPNMKFYRDNQDYGYYEKFLEDEDCINYHCNKCVYHTTNLPSLKRHFDRKVKCYEVKTYGAFDLNNIEIEKLNNNDNHTYYKYLEDDTLYLQCNHCKYKTTVTGNLNRHFKGKNKCWENKD